MAIEPAAISAKPAVTTMPACATAPESPAASANGTVSPSDMPMTTSRTISLAVKWRSVCRVSGMCALCRARRCLHVVHQTLDLERLLMDPEYRIADRADRLPFGDGRGHDGVRHELGVVLLHVAQHRPAVDARHHQVEEHDVEAVTLDRGDGLVAVAVRLDGEALMLDDGRQQRADRFVVIDDERAGHERRRASLRPSARHRGDEEERGRNQREKDQHWNEQGEEDHAHRNSTISLMK